MLRTYERSRLVKAWCESSLFARFAAHRAGAIGMMFALMLLPLCGLVGLAVDYGLMTRAQTEINAAADSATLVATTIAADLYTKSTNPDDTAAANAAVQQGRAAGLRIFATQIADLGYMASSNPSLTVTPVTNNGTTSFNAILNYSSTSPGYFASLFGFRNLPVSGTAQAEVSASSYVDFHVLIDNSQSMLIGEKQEDMDNIDKYVHGPQYGSFKNTTQDFAGYCPIACHFSKETVVANSASNGPMVVPHDFLGIARLENIHLRLDVVQSSVGDLISSIQQKSNNSKMYQVGVYAFDDPNKTDVEDGSPTTIYKLGSNFPVASQLVSNLQVPRTTRSMGDTSFAQDGSSVSIFDYAAGQIASSNQNGSRANHKQIVFIITDGVKDRGEDSTRSYGPISPADCDVFKKRKMQVYVLYTTYVPISTDPGYCANMSKFAGGCTYSSEPASTQLYANMKACASSPANFFNATKGDEITAAMRKMLNAAIGQAARITL